MARFGFRGLQGARAGLDSLGDPASCQPPGRKGLCSAAGAYLRGGRRFLRLVAASVLYLISARVRTTPELSGGSDSLCCGNYPR